MKSAETSARIRFPVLDGVRGTAILYVTFSHMSNRQWIGFSGEGEFGVWLFFVLSAFLLSLYFYRDAAKMHSAKEWANYFFRRFMRIYPIYAIALTVGAALGYWGYRTIWGSLVLDGPTYWAIFVEFKFYFVLPFVIVAIESLGRVNKALPCMVVIVYLIVHYCLLPQSELRAGYEAFKIGDWLVAEYAPLFVMGSLAAWVYAQTGHLRKFTAENTALDVVLFLALLAPVFCSSDISNALFGTTLKPDHYHLEWVPWGVVFAAYIYGLMMSDGLVARALSSQPARFFGYVSYSTYLFQDYWIDAIAKWLPAHDLISRWRYAVVSCMLVFSTSALLFVLIERPLSRLSLLKYWARQTDINAPSDPSALPLGRR